MKKFFRKNQRGFTIFFATLVGGLALAIGLAIFDITQRQLSLSSTVLQSQYAVFAADAGVECALYWDSKYQGGTSAFEDGSDLGGQKIIYLTSGSSWVVPADWNSTGSSIEVIGGGGGGSAGATNWNAGTGGGGGGYSKINNITLTPGQTVSVRIGAGGDGGIASNGSGGSGGDTYFCNSTSQCASISDASVIVGAKGGAGGVSQRTGYGGTGGQSSGGVGLVKYSGGNGGYQNTSGGGAGGGGAGGPHGSGGGGGWSQFITGGAGGGGGGGGTDGDSGVNTVGSSGGGNYLGSGNGAGGTAGNGGGAGSSGGGGGGAGHAVGGGSTGPGGAGGGGADWDGTHGSGGGGGGGGGTDNSGGAQTSKGGAGGMYGGGGGGGGSGSGVVKNGGDGAQGIIVIRYTSTGAYTAPTGLLCGSYDITVVGTPPVPYTAPTDGWSPWNVITTATAATTTFTLAFPPYAYCAIVEVGKSVLPDGTLGTTIYSHGYNTCVTNAPNKLERLLKVTY